MIIITYSSSLSQSHSLIDVFQVLYKILSKSSLSLETFKEVNQLISRIILKLYLLGCFMFKINHYISIYLGNGAFQDILKVSTA